MSIKTVFQFEKIQLLKARESGLNRICVLATVAGT